MASFTPRLPPMVDDGTPWDAPIITRRKGQPLKMVPHLVANPSPEGSFDSQVLSASIAVYRHVLPALEKKFLQKLLSAENMTTIALLRPYEDALNEQKEKALHPELIEQDKQDLEAKRLQKKKDEDESEGEDEEGEGDNDSSSSYSYDPNDVEASEEDEDEQGDEEEAEEEEEEDFEDECLREEKEFGDKVRSSGGLIINEAPVVTAKSRMVGCVSFEFVSNKLGMRLLQITLCGIRLKYQRLGIGTLLLRLALNSKLTGQYDAVLTYADRSSIEFWKRHGFTDDVILNSRFKDVIEQWDESTLMSFVVPSSANKADTTYLEQQRLKQSNNGSGSSGYLKMEDVSRDMDEWRARRLEEYSREVLLFEKMKNEIAHLRDRVVRQDMVIEALNADNIRLKRETSRVERDFTVFREQTARRLNEQAELISALETAAIHSSSEEEDNDEDEDEDSLEEAGKEEKTKNKSSAQRARTVLARSSLSSSLASPSSSSASSSSGWASAPRSSATLSYTSALASGVASIETLEPSNREFTSVLDEIRTSLREAHGVKELQVKALFKVNQSRSHLMQRYSARVQRLSDPNMSMRMFFPIVDVETGKKYLELGFPLSAPEIAPPREGADWQQSFGSGYYFTRYASRAARLCLNMRSSDASSASSSDKKSGMALLCLVALGNTCSVLDQNPKRASAPRGYDSIIIPGRRPNAVKLPNGSNSDSWDFSAESSEEYVLFDGQQVLPMYLVEWEFKL